MNFPMTQPIFQFFYWLVNTPGIGGLILMSFVPGVGLAAVLTLNWIKAGSAAQEVETYSYPTPALYEEEDTRKRV